MNPGVSVSFHQVNTLAFLLSLISSFISRGEIVPEEIFPNGLMSLKEQDRMPQVPAQADTADREWISPQNKTNKGSLTIPPLDVAAVGSKDRRLVQVEEVRT